MDLTWPCERQETEAKNYPYPLNIANTWEWKVKDEKEIEDTYDDGENVKFSLLNEYNISMKKREIEFDPNKLQIMRVSYTLNETKVLQHSLLHKSKPDGIPLEFKDKYIISFQQLSFESTDPQTLN